MKAFKYNLILIVVIIIGLGAAMAVNFTRHSLEENNRTIDLAIDYEGLLELAEREGLPPADILKEAREAGITSLAVYETTFKKLNINGKATATPGAAVLERYQSGSLMSAAWRSLVEKGEIIGTEIYVTGHDPLTFREVKEDLIERLGKNRVRSFFADGVEVLAVKAHYKTFEKMNLGMPTDEMKAVNEAGFYVLARPSNYQKVTEANVRAMFKRLDGIKVSEMVFSDKQVTGAMEQLKVTAEEMKKRQIVLGMIEDTTQLQFYKQDGLIDLAKLVDYQAARLYSISKDELPKLGTPGAVARWQNTDDERNIRINLLRIHEKPFAGLSLRETNMQYFKAVADGLKAHGFKLGKASTFAPYFPSKTLLALMLAGVAAAAVLYLSLVIPKLNQKPLWQYAMFVVFALLAVVPVLLGHGAKIRLLASLASANLFPALAVIWQLDRVRDMKDRVDWSFPRLLLMAGGAILVTGTFAYFGAAYLSGVLSDVEYFLEINIFRGIKLTFILPIILVAVAFLQRFDIFDGKMDDTNGAGEQLKKILEMPVKVKTLVVLFMVLVAGVVFVARSGHNMGMPVSGLELKFRAFLEQAMYARPRSKELLIGHPAFMLAALAWWRKWPTMVFFALVLIATIGQGSMVETFAHMRTPVYMSFMRGIGGITLGAVIGAICMTAVEVWQRIIMKTNAKG